jgi:hypothetical protein
MLVTVHQQVAAKGTVFAQCSVSRCLIGATSASHSPMDGVGV